MWVDHVMRDSNCVGSIMEGKFKGKPTEECQETGIWGKSRRIVGRRAIGK
jgi:hypothetical protein